MEKLALETYKAATGHNPGGARGLQVINGHNITILWVDPNTAEYVLEYEGHHILTPRGGSYGESKCTADGHEEKDCLKHIGHEALYALHLADTIT